MEKGEKQFEESSFVITLRLNIDSFGDSVPKSVGWERDSNQKLKPRFINLSSSMNPEQLAESQTSLNLKLMKVNLIN